MKKIFVTFGSLLILLASCTKDSTNNYEPTPSLLGKWQLYNYTIRYFQEGKPDSIVLMTRDSMAQCALDDYWQYNADSSGLAYYGKLCAGESKDREAFGWQLYGDVLQLVYPDGRKEGMTISNVTADYFTSFDTLYPSGAMRDTGTLLQQYRRIQ